MGQLTQTTAQLQVIIDDADDANVGKTSLTDGSDTTAVAFKKSGFYSLQGSSANAPSTDRAVLISAVRNTAATGEIRYGQIAITESNGLWWNRDDGGSLGTWYEAVTTASAQTLTNKTLTSPVLTTPQINDSAADHQYIFAGSNLAADRTVTLPLLTGDDTFVFAAHTQTLTNKTLTTPTVSGLTLSDASIIFEGATANDHETTLTVTDPTADRTITLPDATDTLVGLATTDTLTNKTLTSPVASGLTLSDASIVFEGATANAHETTLTVTDPTADRTITLPDATDTLVGLATTDTLTNKTLTSPVFNTGVSGTAVLDVDDFTGASATKLASSESIKAYVDAQVGSFDQLSEVLAAGNTTGSTDIAVDSAQKVQFRDTGIYINSSADGQLDIVADTEIQIAATTIDVNGNLDVSGTTVSAGKITADAGIDIDDINIDGTTIALSSGDLTLDVASTTIIDSASSGQLVLKHSGTEYGTFFHDSNHYYIQSQISDGDIILRGNDGGSTITALTLDMSEAGAATFNAGATFAGTIAAGAATFTTADNTDTLSLTSTDADANAGPNLRIYRNSGSPADADILGVIDFEGRNDNSQDVVYANITTQAVDVSDGSEDGAYYINTMLGGTIRNRMNVVPTEVVFNEESRDLDFRVESDSNAHALFVDASTNCVNIQTSGGVQSIAGLNSRVNGAAIEFGHTNNSAGYFGTLGAQGNNGHPYLGFSTSAEFNVNTFRTYGAAGNIIAGDMSGNLLFSQVVTASAVNQTPVERMRLDSSGNVGIGGTPATARLEVTGAFAYASGANSLATTVSKAAGRIRGSSDASTSLFFGSLTNDAEQYIQSSNGAGDAADDLALNPYGGNVGIGCTPSNKLDIKGTVGFEATNSTNKWLAYHYTDNTLRFNYNGAGADELVINSSGSLLVGLTDTTGIATGATADNGIYLDGSVGAVVAQSSANKNLYLSKATGFSDPDFISLQVAGAAVGSIFNSGTTMGIGSLDTGVLLANNLDAILPWNSSTNAERGSAIDLGRASTGLFKDLYLSGGVCFDDAGGSGTTSSNYLDAYEEGSWTPVIKDTSATGTTVAISTVACTYTKIGRIVTLVGSFTRNDTATLTGNLVITGLPFTATGGQQMGGNAWVDNASGDILCQITAGNTSTMFLKSVAAPDSYLTTDDLANGRPIYFTRTYQAS
jgi:hypothetical protein